MTDHRIFTLGDDGHINGVEIIDCATDKEALDQVPVVVGDKPAEVWQGARPVGRVESRVTRHL